MSKPFVSVCTPTYNRRKFIPNIIKCFKNQDYPSELLEWIILDDGTEKISDLFKDKDLKERMTYIKLQNKMPIGAKRNYLNSIAKGEIIVYFDDDDYYPPERVSYAVEALTNSPSALCAGSSELHIYFNHIGKMYQSGPFHSKHATAGTFAFFRELLDETCFDDNATKSEESSFLKGFTIPFVQLNPIYTTLMFSHDENTFDKKKILENPNNNEKYFKISNKTISDFIKYDYEEDLKSNYLHYK